MKVLSFGEIIWDVYPNKSCIGGAPLNFAAHVAKSGAQSYLLSCVGDDNLGKQAIDCLEKFDVNASFVGVCRDKQTGICKVILDENAVPTYTIVDDVAYDYITCKNELFNMKFDLLAFGTLALRSKNNRDVLNKIVDSGTFDKIYCDINLRVPFFDREVVDFCLKSANIIKVSANEIDFMSKEVLHCNGTQPQKFVKILAQAYPNLEVVLLTCGEQGSVAYVASDDKIYCQQAIKTKVVSTVGAGDSFGAVFVTSLLDGLDVQTCLHKGAERSAYVVSHAEAVPD